MAETMDRNPLLDIRFPIPFDQVKAEHVEPAVEELLRDAEAKVEAVAADAGPRTFVSTMLALEAATERLEYAMSIVRHLEAVATTPTLREAHNRVQGPVSAFFSRIPLHAGLWRQLQAYAATDEARALTGTRARFLKKTMDSFRRHGAELDDAGKKRLNEIDVALTKATTKFSQNVLDSTNEWELLVKEEAQLAGLPPSALAAARQSAEAKGHEGWRFTLQAPSYVAVQTYLDDASIREAAYRAYNTRATAEPHDNRALIQEILTLRREKAELLRYADFADLVLEDRMAHTGARAETFLDELKGRTQARFREENGGLYQYRREREGESAEPLQAWDVGYYAEKQRAALYDFDEEALRPYFPLPQVVSGMFTIFGRLFGIVVQPAEGISVWAAGVTYYEIRDAGTERLLGGFYADWHPRESKRGGAWMDAFLTGVDGPQGHKPHLGLICGNLTPPIGDQPALLTHREVETIFHEFGHLLHHCLSRVEVRSLAGTNVAWDFVELPSQIMENWCWEREALDQFARHFETGVPIPDELFERMRRARTFRAANGQMRQLGFGLMDLALHRHYQPERDGDVLAYVRAVLQAFAPAPLIAGYAMVAGFTHLFASPVGYGAGYYSYKWAEVLDADAFTRFRREGLFSEQVGGEFRDRILSRGDSEDPAELYRSFMGRDPEVGALLERNGLAVV